MSIPTTSVIALASSLVLAACSDDAGRGRSGEPASSQATAPDLSAVDLSAVELGAPDTSAPDKVLASMDLVEDYSEEVADRLIGFGDKLRRRDFGACEDWLSEDFIGHSIAGLPVGSAQPMPLETHGRVYDVSGATSVDRGGFLAAIQSHLGPWQRVDSAIWKVKAADFQAGARTWGRVRLRLTALGVDARGGPASMVLWGHARAVKRGGEWTLNAFSLDSLTTTERAQAMFTDVSVPAGVAHAGIRFGQPGNTSFAWNGAASGDVDGDGYFDLFVPSAPDHKLYVANRKDGYREEANERGLAGGGGTGAVFFDFDHDGDQDLAVGDVGWKEADGTERGNRLRFYVNDGKGHFTESGKALGFNALCHAYTLTVLDVDADGYLDVFVCNYGRVDAAPNNSWVQATNGTPNALYRNEGGKGFREVAQEYGLIDTGWTFAATAADYDSDGDTDLYVANDYGRNSLWRNDGGTFKDVAAEEGVTDLGNGMGALFGDLNGDGLLDLYVANMSSTAGNRILRRLSEESGTADLVKMAAGNSIFLRGENGFHRLESSKGGIGASWAWSPAILDINLDGRLDLYCASGFVTGDTLEDT